LKDLLLPGLGTNEEATLEEVDYVRKFNGTSPERERVLP
jgi:hypothetical protein